MSSVLAFIASITTGVATFIALQPTFTSYHPTQKCDPFDSTYLVPPTPANQAHDHFYRLNVPYLDTLHCWMTQFFMDAFRYPSYTVGNFVAQLIFSTFAGILLLVAIEASRSSAKLAAKSTAFVAFVSQALGASIAIPFVWLPSWLYSYAYVPASKRTPLAQPTVLLRTAVAVGVFLIISIVMIAVKPETPTSEHPLTYFVLIFLYWPIVMPIVWTPITPTPTTLTKAETLKRAIQSSTTARKIYSSATGVLTILYIFTVQVYWRNISVLGYKSNPLEPIWNLFNDAFLLGTAAPNTLPAYFLLVDTLSLVVTMTIWVAHEGGVKSMAAFLVGCVFIGPGAAVCAYAMSLRMEETDRLEAELKREKGKGAAVEGETKKGNSKNDSIDTSFATKKLRSFFERRSSVAQQDDVRSVTVPDSPSGASTPESDDERPKSALSLPRKFSFDLRRGKRSIELRRSVDIEALERAPSTDGYQSSTTSLKRDASVKDKARTALRNTLSKIKLKRSMSREGDTSSPSDPPTLSSALADSTPVTETLEVQSATKSGATRMLGNLRKSLRVGSLEITKIAFHPSISKVAKVDDVETSREGEELVEHRLSEDSVKVEEGDEGDDDVDSASEKPAGYAHSVDEIRSVSDGVETNIANTPVSLSSPVISATKISEANVLDFPDGIAVVECVESPETPNASPNVHERSLVPSPPRISKPLVEVLENADGSGNVSGESSDSVGKEASMVEDGSPFRGGQIYHLLQVSMRKRAFDQSSPTWFAAFWMESLPDLSVFKEAMTRVFDQHGSSRFRSVPVWNSRQSTFDTHHAFTTPPQSRNSPPSPSTSAPDDLFTWIPVPDFDVSDHVVIRYAPNETTIIRLLNEELQAEMDLEKPLWTCLVLVNERGGKSCICFIVHHVIGSEMAVMELLCRLFKEGRIASETSNQQHTGTSQSAFEDPHDSYFGSTSTHTSELMGVLDIVSDQSLLNRASSLLSIEADEESEPALVFAKLFAPLSLDALQRIAGSARLEGVVGGVSVLDVVVGCVAGALRRYLLEVDRDRGGTAGVGSLSSTVSSVGGGSVLSGNQSEMGGRGAHHVGGVEEGLLDALKLRALMPLDGTAVFKSDGSREEGPARMVWVPLLVGIEDVVHRVRCTRLSTAYARPLNPEEAWTSLIREGHASDAMVRGFAANGAADLKFQNSRITDIHVLSPSSLPQLYLYFYKDNVYCSVSESESAPTWNAAMFYGLLVAELRALAEACEMPALSVLSN
ncbi:hypothetical protein HDV05_003210 [Chytridiales sp. JEL 0842]|nr:hypothetical protein HDV05_003210 [Chytridiales sp. JEL 0842]